MCCFFTSLVFFGPRLAALVWWLINPARFTLAFSGWIVPLLGFLFLPWTFLMYLIVFPGPGWYGIQGFDWVWMGLALFVDIVSYAGSGYGNKDRMGY
ncbi:MAG: hypothetical protein U9R58_16360 [Chloroflexota bacterium]|nr:hypothetical protein [Chloroflexota bacterium]